MACFRVHLSDGSTFSAGQNWGTTTSFSSNADTFRYGIMVGDFNGDGQEDLVYRGTDSNSSQWIVQRSTGTGFITESWSDAFGEGTRIHVVWGLSSEILMEILPAEMILRIVEIVVESLLYRSNLFWN